VTTRTGLAAHVPSLEWSRKLAAVPALAEAFGKSYAVWYGVWSDEDYDVTWLGIRGNEASRDDLVPAPLVDELLAWLLDNGVGTADVDWIALRRIVDNPDALVQACIAAAGKGEK